MTPEEIAAFLSRRHDRPGDVLMETIRRPGGFIAPGTYCGQDAKIAREIREEYQDQCAFNAVYGSGWAISCMLWGLPDMGFHDRSMMTLIGKFITLNAYPLPVILDAETGLGNAITLMETVQAYHDIGVGMAHMEDQEETAPRRCGNMKGKKCVPPEDMVVKIRSWLMKSHAIRTSMRLMVRTDALTAAGGGLEDAIERGKRYMDVDYQGRRPDVLWADAMIGPEVIDPWIEAMRKHDPNMILAINYSPNKDWMTEYQVKRSLERPPTYEELHLNGEGFRVIFHTIITARAAMEAARDTLEDVARSGASALWRLHERQRNHPVGKPQKMSGADEWQTLEGILYGDVAKERYEQSQGYGETPKP